jgi:hypothetical protein
MKEKIPVNSDKKNSYFSTVSKTTNVYIIKLSEKIKLILIKKKEYKNKAINSILLLLLIDKSISLVISLLYSYAKHHVSKLISTKLLDMSSTEAT